MFNSVDELCVSANRWLHHSAAGLDKPVTRDIEAEANVFRFVNVFHLQWTCVRATLSGARS